MIIYDKSIIVKRRGNKNRSVAMLMFMLIPLKAYASIYFIICLFSLNKRFDNIFNKLTDILFSVFCTRLLSQNISR